MNECVGGPPRKIFPNSSYVQALEQVLFTSEFTENVESNHVPKFSTTPFGLISVSI